MTPEQVAFYEKLRQDVLPTLRSIGPNADDLAAHLGGDHPIRPDLARIADLGRKMAAIAERVLDHNALVSGTVTFEDVRQAYSQQMPRLVYTCLMTCHRVVMKREAVGDEKLHARLDEIIDGCKQQQRLALRLERLDTARFAPAATPEPAVEAATPPPAAPATAILGVKPQERTASVGISVLVVDSGSLTSQSLAMRLELLGYTCRIATSCAGADAILADQADTIDLVVLDLMVDGGRGHQFLHQLRTTPATLGVPVIVTSGRVDTETVARSIKLGAEDHMFKPLNPILLKARVASCLENKFLRDEQKLLREQAERLLQAMLPRRIAQRLYDGETVIAEQLTGITVLFADLVGFTPLSVKLSPPELVGLLNSLFSAFDKLTEIYGLEKIKTSGDAYIIAGGLGDGDPNHIRNMGLMALDMQEQVKGFSERFAHTLSCRIGIHIGPLVGGVIGNKRFVYDIWGDTVNTASRMESHGERGRIQVTQAYRDAANDFFEFEPRGIIHVKGKGEMPVHFLDAALPDARLATRPTIQMKIPPGSLDPE